MSDRKKIALEVLNDLRIIHDFIMGDNEKKAILHLGMLMAALHYKIQEETEKEPKNDEQP